MLCHMQTKSILSRLVSTQKFKVIGWETETYTVGFIVTNITNVGLLVALIINTYFILALWLCISWKSLRISWSIGEFSFFFCKGIREVDKHSSTNRTDNKILHNLIYRAKLIPHIELGWSFTMRAMQLKTTGYFSMDTLWLCQAGTSQSSALCSCCHEASSGLLTC